MSFLYQPPFGIETIEKIIPHRYPFLLVDRITELGEDTVRGTKCLSMNEEVFSGHFPGHPVYPGVLQIETMAQVGAVWILAHPEHAGKIAYLMTVKEAKFRAPAVPGDVLEIFGRISHLKSRTGVLDATISVSGKLVSSCSIMFAFQKEESSAP